jgi:ribokinase
MIQALPDNARAAFIDTTMLSDVLPLGAPRESDVPDSWLETVDHWHLPLLPLIRHRNLVDRIASGRGMLQTDCPARSDLMNDAFGQLAVTLGHIQIFLPSTSDFDVVAPGVSIENILLGLRSKGAHTVVLKAGGDGVYILWGDEFFHLPAYDTAAVDPTGAGDAFCGGFMAGMASNGDVVAAAALGSAAASFAIATEDPLTLIGVNRDHVRNRARHLHRMAKRIHRDELPEKQFGGSGFKHPSAVNE